MAFEQPGFKPTSHTAKVDLDTKQFYCVKMDTVAGSDVVLAGDGDAILGLLQGKPKAGQSAEIMSTGVSKAAAGAAFGRNVELASNALGKLITAASGKRIVATSVEPSGADGNIVSVQLLASGAVKP